MAAMFRLYQGAWSNDRASYQQYNIATAATTAKVIYLLPLFIAFAEFYSGSELPLLRGSSHRPCLSYSCIPRALQLEASWRRLHSSFQVVRQGKIRGQASFRVRWCQLRGPVWYEMAFLSCIPSHADSNILLYSDPAWEAVRIFSDHCHCLSTQ